MDEFLKDSFFFLAVKVMHVWTRVCVCFISISPGLTVWTICPHSRLSVFLFDRVSVFVNRIIVSNFLCKEVRDAEEEKKEKWNGAWASVCSCKGLL